MGYRIVLLVAIGSVFAFRLVGREWADSSVQFEMMADWQCRRIVSLSPSVTETLKLLGLGDRIVGVSQADSTPRLPNAPVCVGEAGLPKFERMIALEPDLVILVQGRAEALPKLECLKIQTLVVSHDTMDAVIESFRSIGRVCGKGAEGRRIAEEYEDRLEHIAGRTRMLPKPSVLMTVGRFAAQGYVPSGISVGTGKYFNRLIELAGGKNAYCDRSVKSSIVSPEGILLMNPEVIVDFAPVCLPGQSDWPAIVADWNELDSIAAVQQGRVFVFGREYPSSPGPRFIELIEDLARVIHPEANLD